MADSKITALTSIGASTDPANDPLVLVDVSDTSMAASGTTKKVTLNNLLACSPTATLASATITGDLTVDTSTLKVSSSTDTVCVGATTTDAKFRVIDANYNGIRIGFLPGTFNYNLYDATTHDFRTANVTPQSLYTFSATSAIWYDGAGGTRMTLNSTGLGVGTATIPYKLTVASPGSSNTMALINNTSNVSRLMFAENATPSNAYSAIEGDGRSTGYIALRTNDTERLRVDSSGNVGVGVTPSAWSGGGNIELNGSTGNIAFRVVSTLACNWYYNSGDKFIGTGYAQQYQQYQGVHKWFTSTLSGSAGGSATMSQLMTLTANGNLLIGTTTDVSTVKMQVWSPDSNNTVYFRNSHATTPYGPSIKYTAATPNNTGSEFLYCEDSTALRVSLRSNGGIANYQANDVSLSDSRLKTDIKPLASYWNKIKSLELVTFKYKDQTHSDDNIGLIAQQVESVAPELVDVDGFGETPADGVPLKTIYTTDLYHASIKALQEAMARIEALEAKLA